MAANNKADDGADGHEYNPIIADLVGADEHKPIVISGYAGKDGNSQTSIRIYSSLEDLTSWHEVIADHIISRVTPRNPLHPATFFLKSAATPKHIQPLQHVAQAKFISGSLMARHFAALHPTGAVPPTTLLCHPGGPPPMMTSACHPIVINPQGLLVKASVTDEWCPYGMMTSACRP